MKDLAVEIFHNNTFCKWFPAHSIKEVLETIQRLEGKELIAEIEYSYLVFQNSKDGKYKGMDGKSYHLVSRINSKGKEKPKFFQEG